jgi:hypothetical protein
MLCLHLLLWLLGWAKNEFHSGDPQCKIFKIVSSQNLFSGASLWFLGLGTNWCWNHTEVKTLERLEYSDYVDPFGIEVYVSRDCHCVLAVRSECLWGHMLLLWRDWRPWGFLNWYSDDVLGLLSLFMFRLVCWCACPLSYLLVFVFMGFNDGVYWRQR